MDGIEQKVLKEISKRLVVRKSELKDFLKRFKKAKEVDSITKSLNRKGLITYVSVIGESCIAITQRGMRELEK